MKNIKWKLKLKKSKRKKISKECWNLNYELIYWLNQHLKIYLKEASRVIALERNIDIYNGKEYNEKQLIEKLIELTEPLIDADYFFGYKTEDINDIQDRVSEMYDILKVIHFRLWW